MSTDFFTSQDTARRRTGRLVVLFMIGVVATMASLWAVIAASVATQRGPSAWTDPTIALGVVVVVGGIVGVVTLVKLAQLSQGGDKIAQMLGGVRIHPATANREERQLLNIVEEMSIASGVPIPPVYVMQDNSINAFAAGPDPSRSVIGVTRGLMQHLDRDEIQGVIAHEYSHIFHGDTRINARTTAIIAGIMAVGVLGYVMFRYIGPALARSGGGKNNPGPAVGAVLCILGLVVWAIGSLGMLFGRLIQAAISRQREFLADAAAVQYTRNPDGIAGALAKIRDHYSARIAQPAASELNHFFFCTSLNTLFATHPPIDERIKRLAAMGAVKTAAAAAAPARPVPKPSPVSQGTGAPPLPQRPAVNAIGLAGTLGPETIARSQDWMRGMPAELTDAARRASGARAICYLIARRSEGEAAAVRVVERDDPEAARFYHALAPSVARQSPAGQLALADLCAPALAALGPKEYSRFRATLAEVMRSDGKMDLREWALAKSLERHVERRFVHGTASATLRIAELDAAVRTVLAAIAVSEHDEAERKDAFKRGCRQLGIDPQQMPLESTLTLDALNTAVQRLSKCRFVERERMLEACAATAMHDGDADSNEFLVVRSVADALDVPVPPLAFA